MLRDPSRPAAAPQPSPTPSLSAHLKAITAPAHRQTEALMDLTSRLRTIPRYIGCLQLFLRVFTPIEQSLGQFSQWETFGIDIASRMRAHALRADLLALGATIPPLPPAAPAFATFAEALGGLYVTEGSTIGGQFITRAIIAALGEEAAGKTAFFQGHGAETGPMWNRLRASIDQFGAAHPDQRDDVAAGALASFARFAAAATAP
jgi:heme oxygenase